MYGDSMAEEKRIKLYQFEYCPYCIRVRNVLDEKKIPYEIVEVDPANTDEVYRLSGQRLVPMIVDGNEVINDSSVIIEYLNKKYG